MSITKTRKLKRTSPLDTLARGAGSCYSKVISLVRKTKQHKGVKSNQKLHQWAFARIAQKICYKAELAGIKVVSESEAYTSQTCPKCGHRKKPKNRNYHCKQCDFRYHRDGVGAINIRNE